MPSPRPSEEDREEKEGRDWRSAQQTVDAYYDNGGVVYMKKMKGQEARTGVWDLQSINQMKAEGSSS